MGMTGFLDIAIGLVFMYLVLSLICTTVNELIATFLKLRAKDLAKTCTALIDDKEIRKAFYDHGLISNAGVASRNAGPVDNAPAPAGGTVPRTAAPATGISGEPSPTNAVGSAVKGAQVDAAGTPRDWEHP